MPTHTEDLGNFVRRQSAEMLSALLLELADAHPAVKHRLQRLQMAASPDRLAASFRKTLTGWRRQTRFLDYRASIEWAAEAEVWLRQIEHELLPLDPAAVVALAEAFIECDEKLFDRADDSSGRLGDALRAACCLWLRAAAACETPADAWPARLRRLFEVDRHGTREALLAHADLLLSPDQMRGLVADFERELDLAPPPDGPSRAEFRTAHAALSLLSQALRDPDVHVRATLRRSPQPNALQKQGFVRKFLAVGRAADALPWLEAAPDWHEPARLRLLAEALRALGQAARSAAIQQQVFEQTLAVEDFRCWLQHLPATDHAAAFQHARERALGHDEPVAAAMLLVDIGGFTDAEQVLLAQAARISGRDYTGLVPLAKALEAQQCWRGATAVLRALLGAILDKAYAPAYGHAARYWHRLHAMAPYVASWVPLQPHAEYAALLRQKHARKVAFWAQVAMGQGADSWQGDASESDHA